MAKDKDTKKETKAEAPEFKYGVEDIATELGIKAASVRVQLRNKNIDKAGKAYGWNTKAELDGVISQLKADSKPKAEKAEKAEKKAPAKAKAKVTVKKVGKKAA